MLSSASECWVFGCISIPFMVILWQKSSTLALVTFSSSTEKCSSALLCFLELFDVQGFLLFDLLCAICEWKSHCDPVNESFILACIDTFGLLDQFFKCGRVWQCIDHLGYCFKAFSLLSPFDRCSADFDSWKSERMKDIESCITNYFQSIEVVLLYTLWILQRWLFQLILNGSTWSYFMGHTFRFSLRFF